jgi:hypothetical protein
MYRPVASPHARIIDRNTASHYDHKTKRKCRVTNSNGEASRVAASDFQIEVPKSVFFATLNGLSANKRDSGQLLSKMVEFGPTFPNDFGRLAVSARDFLARRMHH